MALAVPRCGKFRSVSMGQGPCGIPSGGVSPNCGGPPAQTLPTPRATAYLAGRGCASEDAQVWATLAASGCGPLCVSAVEAAAALAVPRCGKFRSVSMGQRPCGIPSGGVAPTAAAHPPKPFPRPGPLHSWQAAGARQKTLRFGLLWLHQAAGHCAFLPSVPRRRLPSHAAGSSVRSLWGRGLAAFPRVA